MFVFLFVRVRDNFQTVTTTLGGIFFFQPILQDDFARVKGSVVYTCHPFTAYYFYGA